MDPLTIAASAAKITLTCITTGTAIYNLSCKYKDAPRSMVAISSEASVMGASFSQIQAFILSNDDPENLLRSRPDIAATLDRSLTGCMVLFSCLDEEIRKGSSSADGHDVHTWKTKARVVWKHETFQGFLDDLRGQQLAINLLLQLLQMDSLFEIKQLLRQKAPHLRKVMESTQSLRHSYPSIDVAESIYNEADSVSVYSDLYSMTASSELNFAFDDIIVNSVAYRRALAGAKSQAPDLRHDEAHEDLIDFSDDATICQATKNVSSAEPPKFFADLEGLRFPAVATESCKLKAPVPLHTVA